MAPTANDKRNALIADLKRLDPEADGSISVALVHKAMKQIGIKFTLEDLSKELLKNDKDGDGEMEVSEVDKMLQEEAALATMPGLEGTLEPWSLGRSLALDALPMAARAFSAHSVVREVIRRGSPEKEKSRDRRGRSRRTSGDAPADSSKEADNKPAPVEVPDESASPMKSPTSAEKARMKAEAEAAALKKRSPMFVMWEETKRMHKDFDAMRKEYEQSWPKDAWKISGTKGRSRYVPRKPTSSASLGSLKEAAASSGGGGGTPWAPQGAIAFGRSETPSASMTGTASNGRLLAADAQQSLYEMRQAERQLLTSGHEPRSVVRRKAEERRLNGQIRLISSPSLPSLLQSSSTNSELTGGLSRTAWTPHGRPISPTKAMEGPSVKWSKPPTRGDNVDGAKSRFEKPADEKKLPPSAGVAALRRSSSMNALTGGLLANQRPLSRVLLTTPAAKAPEATAAPAPAAAASSSSLKGSNSRLSSPPKQRPHTSAALEAEARRVQRRTAEASHYVGSLLVNADRAHDGRPSTGLRLVSGHKIVSGKR